MRNILPETTCITQYFIDRVIIENLYLKTNQFLSLIENITDKIIREDSLTEIYSLVLDFIEMCIYDCVPILLVEDQGELVPFLSNNHHHTEFLDIIHSCHFELIKYLKNTHNVEFYIDEWDLRDNDGLRKVLYEINIRSILSIPITNNKDESMLYLVILFPYKRKNCISLYNYINIAKNLLILANTKINIINKFIKIIEEKDELIKIKIELLAYISHEIRNLMNAVNGMIDLIYNMELNEQYKSYVTLIKSSVDTTISLLNDMTELARLEYGKIELEEEEIDLEELAKHIVDMFESNANRKGIKIRYYISNDLPLYVLGDKKRINQVLINLVSNAIKFTNSGNVIVKIQKCSKTGNILFSVSDTGIGIPKDKLSLIFEKFTQADRNVMRFYGGTGLGLSISLNLVRIMNGDIWVESEEGKGSTFYVSLPLKPILKPKTKRANNEGLTQNLNLPPLKILVVDDVQLNQLFLKRILEKSNLVVEIANNGAEAIEILKKGQFDMVIMDVYMPILNGIEATKRIRNGETKNTNIPIIALTAGVDETEKKECLEAGMNEFLTKPVKINSLFSTILKFINNH